jgi:predicted nucleic acid-binding protein
MATFIDALRQMSMVTVISAHQDLLTQAWLLYRQRPDKAWGLTDCTSFVTMSQENLLLAFTSDHHFEQAGFIKLMSANLKT